MLPIVATALMESPSLGEAANMARTALKGSADKAAKAAGDFESLFASQLLKEMRKTLDPETMFGGDSGDVYGGMFDLFLGQQIAQSGGLGLANMVREALQGAQSPAAFEASEPI